ncbi:MAG TPA: J domain-containing protein [Acidimicrobiales bacterium]|nr:J domain-containing protein [Acidimicrobiales bacterium]
MNPHDVLGVATGATRDDIHRAWRRRALETHPDRGGDRASFERVQVAFARLSRGLAGTGGPAPVLVRRLGPGGHVLRWYRRRRDRSAHPRVA